MGCVSICNALETAASVRYIRLYRRMFSEEPNLKRCFNAITATKQPHSGPTLSSNHGSLSYDLNPKRNVGSAYCMWRSALRKHQNCDAGQKTLHSPVRKSGNTCWHAIKMELGEKAFILHFVHFRLHPNFLKRNIRHGFKNISYRGERIGAVSTPEKM
jgi:hypothetical protein